MPEPRGEMMNDLVSLLIPSLPARLRAAARHRPDETGCMPTPLSAADAEPRVLLAPASRSPAIVVRRDGPRRWLGGVSIIDRCVEKEARPVGRDSKHDESKIVIDSGGIELKIVEYAPALVR